MRPKAPAAGLAALLVLAAGLALAVPAPASASHNGTTSLRCEYVLANGLAQQTVHRGGPYWLDLGGCHWTFPDSGGSSGGVNPQRAVAGEWNSAAGSIVDDVWGTGGIGAVLCNDGDGDGTCGETDEGEERSEFCGGGPPFTSDVDWDGDGHPDFGASLTLLVNGPGVQTLRCGSMAPVGGTTGGVVDPAGGAFVSLWDGEV